MKPLCLAMVLPVVLAIYASTLGLSEVRAADCTSLVGTFLTKNAAEGGNYTSRSLLSLTEGGVALFVDSGEGGEPGFAPFTDGRGAWRCVPGEKGKVEIRATTLDFTLATALKAQIGRLDFDFDYDAENKTVSGTATLYFVPLEADPLGVLKDGRPFKIAGVQIEAPRALPPPNDVDAR